jgi:O-antigen ligase
MKNDALTVYSRKLIFLGLIFTTLVTTPWHNLDPINLPKFVSLSLMGSVCWLLVVLNRHDIFTKVNRPISVIILMFVFWLFIVTLNSDVSNSLELYGVQGRNTGLLTYMSLAGLLLIITIQADEKLAAKILSGILIAGGGNFVYGLIQSFGLDPIPWNNPFNAILGTLGNPNFVSSFLGLFSVVLFERCFQGSFVSRAVHLTTLCVNTWLILKSDSIQGIFVSAIGIVVLFSLYLWRSKKSLVLALLLFVSSSSLGVLTSIGIFGRGPLAFVSSNDTLTYRMDYWLAGWKMFLSSPWLGIGLDGYGDSYRTFRSAEAFSRRGPDVVTDSSHNVLVDLLASGGLPIAILYILIIFQVVRSSIKIMREAEGFDRIGFTLVALWISHLSQSFFSINQIGLTIWFWAISGAILAYEKNRKSFKSTTTMRSSPKLSAGEYLLTCIVATMAIILSSPPLIKDYRYREALKSADVLLISKITETFPRDSFYYNRTILLFKDNNYWAELLPLARKSVQLNPRNYWGWKLIAENPGSAIDERSKAIEMLRLIDPNNPEFK